MTPIRRNPWPPPRNPYHGDIPLSHGEVLTRRKQSVPTVISTPSAPYTQTQPFESLPVEIPFSTPPRDRIRILERINIQFLWLFLSQGASRGGGKPNEIGTPIPPEQQPFNWELLLNGKTVLTIPFDNLPIVYKRPPQIGPIVNGATYWGGLISTDPINRIIVNSRDQLQWRYSGVYIEQPETKETTNPNMVVIRFILNRTIAAELNPESGLITEGSGFYSSIQYLEEAA